MTAGDLCAAAQFGASASAHVCGPGCHVQTKCGWCQHSAAAHDRGPCQGIDIFGRTENRTGGIELCQCPGLRDPFTVLAAAQ